MVNNRGHDANAKEIQMRIDNGQLQTYFNRLPRNESSLLAKALEGDNFEDIAIILEKNLSAYGRSLSPILVSAYESQIKQLAESLIEETVDDIEDEIAEAVETEDYDKLKKIAETLEELKPISKRSEDVVKKIDKIALKVRVPFSLKNRVRKTAKEKEFKINRTTKAGVYESWSNKKPAFVVFNNGKLVTWRNIPKKQYDKFSKFGRLKIDFKPTTKKRIKETIKIESMGGTPFSNKEELFIKSRSNMGVNDVYSDYLKKFGKIRPKGEILKKIRGLSF